MLDEILDIINKNLPAQVGDTLKKRLEKADADAKALDAATRELTRRERMISDLEAQLKSQCDIQARIDALNKGEAELTLKRTLLDKDEAVLKARTELTREMLNRDKEIVLAVFANNKMKYSEQTQVPFAFGVPPTPGNSYPSPQSTVLTGSRQVESSG